MVKQPRIWANLVHLSYNMWCDRSTPETEAVFTSYKPFLRFDTRLWDELFDRMVQAGLNMVVLDVGDAVRYESHPEIAVRNAWTPARLRRELARMRAAGIEPVPKLNFSTAHDAWLGPYSRRVSTDAYYAVCRDLIREVACIFGKPRFFHLGMDEETAQHQWRFEYAVMRQHDLWWRDLYFYFKHTEAAGCRPWVWSDYLWHHPDLFWKKMPKHVMQSNWYYGLSFSRKLPCVKAYLDLDAHGYEQIPTGSNWSTERNFERTVSFCTRNLKPAKLRGFLQSSWKPTIEACRERNIAAIEQVGKAIRWSSAIGR